MLLEQGQHTINFLINPAYTLWGKKQQKKRAHTSLPVRATLWTHKATYSHRGKGQADWRESDLAQRYVAAVTSAFGCLLSMLNCISHLVRLETQSVHPLTCWVRCNYPLQFFCCVTGNWCLFPQEGLKSVLIVNLSRPSLSPGSLPPPWGINTNFTQQPPSPIFTILRTEGPTHAYLLPNSQCLHSILPRHKALL